MNRRKMNRAIEKATALIVVFCVTGRMLLVHAGTTIRKTALTVWMLRRSLAPARNASQNRQIVPQRLFLRSRSLPIPRGNQSLILSKSAHSLTVFEGKSILNRQKSGTMNTRCFLNSWLLCENQRSSPSWVQKAVKSRLNENGEFWRTWAPDGMPEARK